MLDNLLRLLDNQVAPGQTHGGGAELVVHPPRVTLTFGGILLWYPKPIYPLRLALTPHKELVLAGGAIICLLGLFIAIWSRWTLAGNWSSDVAFKQGHELVKTGPYRFVRHPIYTGLLLMCLGTALANGWLHSWLGFLIQCLGLWIKLQQEESLLMRHFPSEYASYRKQVKALVPFLL